MPRSPTSSEDEMAQSFSEYSQESSSESSKEEAIYETIRTERPVSRMTDVQSHSLVIRVNIPDLQQTVSVFLLHKSSLTQWVQFVIGDQLLVYFRKHPVSCFQMSLRKLSLISNTQLNSNSSKIQSFCDSIPVHCVMWVWESTSVQWNTELQRPVPHVWCTESSTFYFGSASY